MALKIKAGTVFVLPVEIDDPDFDHIDAIEFIFKQELGGETLKTAYWSRDGESRDCRKKDAENIIFVMFSREDSYQFLQDDMFQLDTRIHYENSVTNPYTNIIRLRMNATLFENGEEVSADG